MASRVVELAADVGDSSGYDDGIDVTSAQDRVQIGRSLDEGAEPVFLDRKVFWSDIEARPQLVAIMSGGECVLHAVTPVAGGEMVAPHRPGYRCLGIECVFGEDNKAPPARTAAASVFTLSTISRATGTSAG